MKPKIFILATARRPELLPWTLLVFNSLRVGFPTSEVHVTGNALPEFALQPVKDACGISGAEFKNGLETVHHEWIQSLFETQADPFILLDTDCCFYDKVEDWTFGNAPLAGRRIMEFRDEFSGCLTRSRLHTSLLYISPEHVKERLKSFTGKIAETPFTPISNLIYPLVIPFNGGGVFYDTCSQLFHAVGGQPFSDAQNECFFHANFGTISDIVIPRLNGNREGMIQARDYILENPLRGKGIWRWQDQYYLERQ